MNGIEINLEEDCATCGTWGNGMGSLHNDPEYPHEPLRNAKKCTECVNGRTPTAFGRTLLDFIATHMR